MGRMSHRNQERTERRISAARLARMSYLYSVVSVKILPSGLKVIVVPRSSQVPITSTGEVGSRFSGAKRTETGWADGVFLLHAGRKDFFDTLNGPLGPF